MDIKHRAALFKFRLSNHELMIEVGRHKGVPKEERFCPLFPNPTIEDETHFLITYPSLNDLRKESFDTEMTELLSSTFTTSEAKFIALMGNPSATLAKFIYKAMELRREIISQKDV